jgi:hypothetical protein
VRIGSSAEVAFLVRDDFQRRGISTQLLERLTGIAAASGFTGFEAEVFSDNRAMIDVFRESGFAPRLPRQSRKRSASWTATSAPSNLQAAPENALSRADKGAAASAEGYPTSGMGANVSMLLVATASEDVVLLISPGCINGWRASRIAMTGNFLRTLSHSATVRSSW